MKRGMGDFDLGSFEEYVLQYPYPAKVILSFLYIVMFGAIMTITIPFHLVFLWGRK